MDLSVHAPALTSHSGNLITLHGTSAEERDPEVCVCVECCTSGL